jgi:hypothetical protein
MGAGATKGISSLYFSGMYIRSASGTRIPVSVCAA